jgi:uncharacterized protein with NRDE domain
MCLIILANDCHPRYKLVLMANRDEFYARPTSPAAFWAECPSLLAGKDEKEGGTWMGVTTEGRWAALTNYREPFDHDPQAPSRGHLTQNYLEGSMTANSYMQNLLAEDLPYNGYSLLAGTCDQIYYYSNREKVVREVDKGVHGLSNGLLDTPWSKVTKGKKALGDSIQQYNINVDTLFAIMADREPPADHELPNTGMSLEMERMLAALHVESYDFGYGTRSTTIMLIDYHHKVQFWERSFAPSQAGSSSEGYYEFKVG